MYLLPFEYYCLLISHRMNIMLDSAGAAPAKHSKHAFFSRALFPNLNVGKYMKVKQAGHEFMNLGKSFTETCTLYPTVLCYFINN